MASVIVLDACVLIAHLSRDDAHHERATRLLLGLAGEPKLISVLTQAEVLVAPTWAGRRRAAEAMLDQLRIQTCELPSDAAGSLAELRARTNLRMPDCCVLLTAELNSPAEIATFDERLARAASQRGITVHADG